jgi:hypothetical protein
MTNPIWRSFLMAASLTLVAGTALAQTIRVVAPELAVRSRPDTNADAIAIVASGTILEVTARQEGWYEVRVPGTGSSAGQKGFVAAGLVEMIAAPTTSPPAAQTPGNRPGLLSSPGALPEPSADWQARRDQALRERGSGLVKVRTGTPLALAGVAVLIYGSYVKGLFGQLGEEKTPVSEAWTWMGAGAAIAIPGAILLTRGRGQMNAASRELLILEDERLRGQTGALFQFGWGDDRLHAGVRVGPQHATALVGVGW